MPTFSTEPSASHPGLDILAAAAMLGSAPGSTPGAVGPRAPIQLEQISLSSPGPYNPAAAIPAKVVKKILDLEFLEMTEISADDDFLMSGRPGGSTRPPITNISQWVERFSMMAAILSTRFPEKAPELFAYQGSIIRAERNYEGKQWVVYDCQFRREALARKDLNWSVPNLRLYNEAFTGRAKAIPRCSVCLQDDHSAVSCPKNPARPVSWDIPVWPAQAAVGYQPRASSDICRNYNHGRCRKSNCGYIHVCLICQESHASTNCPRRRQNQQRGPRSRSPIRRPTFGHRL